MKRKFMGGKPPEFGTKHDPKSVNYLERSPWYWWYQYLRRSKAKHSTVAADFGDVRQVEFREWWSTDDRGARLFGEPLLEQRVEVLKSLQGLELTPDTLLIRLPLWLSQKYLKQRVAQLLKAAHKGKPGVPSLDRSRAKYRLHARCDVRALALALQVWDLKSGQPHLTWWEIGQKAQVISGKDSLIRASDTPAIVRDKKQALASIAQRHFKRADAAVRNVGKGRFPDYK